MMPTERMAHIRDETHQSMTALIDALRAADNEARATVEAATLAREAADADAAKARQSVAQAHRAHADIRKQLDAAHATHNASIAELNEQLQNVRAELEDQTPRRLAAEQDAAESRKQLREAEHRIVSLERDVAFLQDKLAAANKGRAEAERHEGMFRRALFTYLQERDGPAGTGAPTPETLSWIRKLVEGDLE